MLVATLLYLQFNERTACIHGANIEHWNAWARASKACRDRTFSFAFDSRDKLEGICAKNATGGQGFALLFEQRLLRKMTRMRECHLDVPLFLSPALHISSVALSKDSLAVFLESQAAGAKPETLTARWPVN